jgi:hypothetical protein
MELTFFLSHGLKKHNLSFGNTAHTDVLNNSSQAIVFANLSAETMSKQNFRTRVFWNGWLVDKIV